MKICIGSNFSTKFKFLFFIIALGSNAFAQKTVNVQGTIDNLNTEKLYIQVGDEDNYGSYNAIEAIDVKQGKFVYTAKLNKIVPALLKTENKPNARTMTIYLVPGEKLDLTIKGKQFSYGGSKVYKEMNDAGNFYYPLREEFDSYYDKALARYYAAPEDKKVEINQQINDSIGKKYDEMLAAIESYRKENIGKEGALLFLSDYDNIDNMYNDLLLKDNIKDNADFLSKNRVGAYLRSRIGYVAAKRKLQHDQDSIEQAKLDGLIDVLAKEFTLNDINGNALKLSSLRGKFVVLDFWGSWCGWCIKGIPEMKTYYEKYAGKFEILGIDCNDTEIAWKSAVKKYELPWLHVYNPNESSVLSDYNVTGFPTKVIIDPQGKINKVIVGEDPAFYKYLDQLLGE